MKYVTMEEYLNSGGSVEDVEKLEERLKPYYTYYFEVIIKRLPKSFIKKYCENHGFHDWALCSFELQCMQLKSRKRRNKLIVKLQQPCGTQRKSIVYDNVVSFQSNLPDEFNFINDIDEYGIDEFLVVDKKFFSHEVYFVTGASYKVVFSNIDITDELT